MGRPFVPIATMLARLNRYYAVSQKYLERRVEKEKK